MAGRKLTSIRLSEAVVEYIADMRSNGRKEGTVRTSQYTLDALVRIIGNKVVRNIDKPDITDYYQARSKDNLAASTVNLQTTRLKLFFTWCEEEGYLDQQVRPMRGRGKLDFMPPERLRITVEQFPALLDAAPNPRDRMVMALGLYTMMRESEIRQLRVRDLALVDQTLAMRRYKTNDTDVLPVSTELHDELANYLMWFSSHLGRELLPEDFLVPSNHWVKAVYDPELQRFAKVSVDRLVLRPDRPMHCEKPGLITKAAVKELGYTDLKGVGAHTLRRSAATELFHSLREEGYDSALLTTMAWLGHKNTKTTLEYLDEKRERTVRNDKYKGQVMFKRARSVVEKQAGNVVPLRAASDE